MPDNLRALEEQVAAARSDLERATALHNLAWELRYQDILHGVELAEQARPIAEKLAAADPAHQPLLADIHATLGTLYSLRGDYDAALSESSASLTAFRALGDKRGQIKALRSLGQTYVDLGEAASGLERHLESLALAEEIGDRLEQARSYARIGIAHSHSDDFKTALEYYHNALPIFEELGDLRQQASTHNNASIEHRALKDYDHALEHALRSLELFSQLGDTHGQIHALGNIGDTYARKGDAKRALATLNRRLELAHSSGFRPLLAHARLSLGQFYLSQGNAAESIDHLIIALAIGHEMGQPFLLTECHKALADAYEKIGDLRKALDSYREHARLAQESAQRLNAARFRALMIRQQLDAAHKEMERYRLENEQLEALREQDRRYFEELAQMKNDIMNAATHDLKSPLTSILMCADLLRKHLPDDPQRNALLDRINEQVARMQSMVRGLLDLARLETGRSLRREPTPINPLLREVIEAHTPQAEFRRIRLTFKPVRDTLTLNIDSSQVRSAVDNVVGNAIKYTPDGGRVAIKAARQGDHVSIEVRDTGMGIPAAALPHLFERFYRVADEAHQRVEGSGLGLAIANSIVEQHGGRIDVESRPGKGSAFTLILPINGGANSNN